MVIFYTGQQQPPPIGARPIGPTQTPPGTPTMGAPLGGPPPPPPSVVVPPKAVTPEGATGSGATPSGSGSSQRTTLKNESDEALGDQATIAMILYANQNHPELKQSHPLWADRHKQITKIWKGLPNEKRQPYVQQARENRTQSRMNKSVSYATLRDVALNLPRHDFILELSGKEYLHAWIVVYMVSFHL